jgi:hypothetical protein
MWLRTGLFGCEQGHFQAGFWSVRLVCAFFFAKPKNDSTNSPMLTQRNGSLVPANRATFLGNRLPEFSAVNLQHENHRQRQKTGPVERGYQSCSSMAA